MELTLEVKGSATIVHLIGTVGLADADEFDATLASLVQADDIKQLVIDCGNLELWDDAAIAATINLAREFEAGKRRALVAGLSPRLTADLDRRGMLAFLPMVATVDEALAQLGSS